jgi:hypothetical protein
VSVSSIHEALKAGGRPVKGRMITPEPCPVELAMMAEPDEPEADLFVPLGRIPLLRYPPGEGPLYCGLRRWS